MCLLHPFGEKCWSRTLRRFAANRFQLIGVIRRFRLVLRNWIYYPGLLKGSNQFMHNDIWIDFITSRCLWPSITVSFIIFLSTAIRFKVTSNDEKDSFAWNFLFVSHNKSHFAQLPFQSNCHLLNIPFCALRHVAGFSREHTRKCAAHMADLPSTSRPNTTIIAIALQTEQPRNTV